MAPMADKKIKKEDPESEEEEVEEVEEEEEEEEEEEDEEDDEEEEEEEEEEDEEEEDKDEEEETDAAKRESVRKLLEPFGKDQLIEILKDAALKNRSIVDRITQAADSDTVHRKLFVHGLGWDCTNETLFAVFKEFGELLEANVVTDKVTGKSKGFGFVLFKTREGAQKALKEPQKKIGNRMTASQLASFGPVLNQAASDQAKRKIYVANVAPHVNPEKLRTFFAQFGELEDGPLGYDRVTGKLRGFAIFIYRTLEGAKKVLEEPTKQFEGCLLQCRIAVDKTQQTGEAAMGTTGMTGFPPNNLGLNYPMGLNSGMLGQNPMGLSSGMLGQSGMGLNPGLAMASQMHNSALGTSLSPSVNRTGNGALGLGSVYGAQGGINSISPSVIASYGSQAALQGLGSYQGAQLGQSSASALARSQSGLGSMGVLPSSYLGR